MGALTDQLFYFDPADYDGATIPNAAGNGSATIAGTHQKVEASNFSFLSFSGQDGAARIDLPVVGEFTFTGVFRLNNEWLTNSYAHLFTNEADQLDFLIKRNIAPSATSGFDDGELYHYQNGNAASQGLGVIPAVKKWFLLVARLKAGNLTVSITTDEGEAGSAKVTGAPVPTLSALISGTYSIGRPYSLRNRNTEGVPFDLGPFGFYDREISAQEEADLFNAIFYPPPESEPGGQSSKVSGIVQIDGTPAQRTVRAYSYESVAQTVNGTEVTLTKSLGHATSDPATGEYTIDLLDGYEQRVFVVAFDDYGSDFKPDLAVAVGDRVHPTTPNGHVWECTGSGTLPNEEPAWVIDTETAQLYGTASMIARPLYRPMVHGPVTPEVVQQDPAP